jgi:hypothetical protein
MVKVRLMMSQRLLPIALPALVSFAILTGFAKERSVVFEGIEREQGRIRLVGPPPLGGSDTAFKITAHIKVWISGNKMRKEVKPVEGNAEEMINLFLPDGNYLLWPKKKTGSKTPAGKRNYGGVDPTQMLHYYMGEAQLKKAGVEEMGGRHCDIYQGTLIRRVRIRDENKKITWKEMRSSIKLWARQSDSVVMKRAIQSESGSNSSVIEYKNIKTGVSIPDSLFEVPKDYRIEDRTPR